MDTIAFIGLGIMGSRMAANLQNAGYQLVIHNRTKDKGQNLLDKGAKWADDANKAVKGRNIVISMLSTPEVVSDLAVGANGFLSDIKAGAIWVNCSTINPSLSRELKMRAAEKEISYVDAPVAGTKGPAEKGELLFLVGAEPEDLSRVRPLLEVMGRKILHLGESAQGSDMKMLINLLLGQSMLAFAEALVLGKEMGLPGKTLFDVLLNTPVAAPYLSLVRPKFESGDYEANFPLQWLQKDLQLVSNTAYEQGVAMPSLNLAKEVYALAKQSGYAEKDFSSIYDYLHNKKTSL
ncbi:NAD(P)-dependent oxidoreductase [Poritiphilus flavus]|uniref:NAD-binding protein n=1 Tax=Poritiphilus flavus TaxID=2697053 RepID=A0A6L9EEQ8_9FLAO|nr:NAD(P)-dependent oxidoreductase [Poritiphilus flavus]NAS12789.1 NAD-binding protein [Poritiphilus flavus]